MIKKTSLPSWDLSDLYKSIDDPKIQKDTAKILARAEEFEEKYRGQIKSANATELLSIIKEYEVISQELAKPPIYAQLVFSADSTNPKHGALMQKTEADCLAIQKHLIFFELELIKKSESDLKKLITDPILKNYRHFLEENLAHKPHRLSEVEEKIMADKSLTGSSALVRLFEQELTAKEFIVKGKSKTLSESQTLELLYSNDRKERQAAAKALTIGLQEESRRITFIFNTLAQDKKIDDEYLHFTTPEASRHLSNEISQEIVDTMADAVTEAYPIVQEFYLFKKKLLKLDKLFDYDRYAPIVKAKQKFSFEEAQNMVLEAFGQFSPDYAKTAQIFFDKHWIDADIRKGKNSGAFCMYVTPDTHPFILLNYQGTLNYVSTLAHELGHGIHSSLMRSQTALNFDTPLTMAETSSVFGEMLLFDYLKNKITKKEERLALYVYKIESIFATVFRQIAMYRFEQDFHKAFRTKGELPTEAISELWLARQKEMFGNSVTMTPDYGIWWSYVSHFFHTPFYVYAYSFGELLTLSLYGQYKKRGVLLAKKYLELLSAGGSKSPQELLAPLGIDLNQKAFWQEGLDVIKQMLKDAKELA